MHNGSIDFKTRMVMDANYFYLCGGNCSDPNYVTTDIAKVNRTNFTQVWKQSYISQNDNVANCTFGIALCKDGGIIFGGNNELNDEDYFLTKLYSDCQTNLTGLTYNGGFVAVDGITTWGAGTKTIRGVVRIPSGATLKINAGAIIRFADTRRYNDFDFLAANVFNFTSTNARNSQPSKIIIERGGRLEVDGNTTVVRGLNVCGGEAMWEGIEIYGLSTLSQTPNTNQGYMQVTNGAIIENMYAGVTVGRNAYDAKGQTAHITSSSTDGGGILKMLTGGKIKNSRYDVFFFPYPTGTGSFSATNQSIFSAALFECSGTQPLVDVNYVDNQGNKLGTDIFVYPTLTNTIRFTSDCKFIGNTNLLVKYRGTGIFNGDAGLSVAGSLGAGINNFSDLLYGIFSGKVTSTRALYVSGNRFNNCAKAIDFRGGSYGNFYNNEVNIPTLTTTTPTVPYGFYLSGTPNLYVGGNKFYGLGTGALADNNFGLVISDHGTSAASVWDNDFGKAAGSNGLYIGAQPQRINGISGANTQGLQINCNRFNTANYYDSVVPSSQPSIVCAQGYGTGASQTQAGNVFNDGLPCTVTFENINSSYAFTYFFRNPPVGEFPNCKTTNVSAVQAIPSNNNTCVPDPPCGDPTCATALRTRYESETDVVKKELLRNSLINYYIAVADTPQAAIDLLAPLGTDDAKKKLVTAYIYQQQYTNAQNTLNSIASSNQENIDFKSLHQILLDLANTSQTIFNLTGAQTTTITTIANFTTSNKYAAQVVLTIAKGNVYAEVIDDMGGGGGARIAATSATSTDFKNGFNLYPNPANSNLTIQLNSLPETGSKVIVQVYDVSGKLITSDNSWNNEQQYFNLNIEKMESGIYFLKLTENSSLIGTQKFVVNH